MTAGEDRTAAKWLMRPQDAVVVWAAVAEATGVTLTEMTSRPRTRTVTLARQAAMWLIRRHSWWTEAEIGRMVAAPADHWPTNQVHHALRRVEAAAADSQLAVFVAAISEAMYRRLSRDPAPDGELSPE